MREIKFRAWDEESNIEREVCTITGAQGIHIKGWYLENGYVMRRVTNHPKANKRGYVAEHRLVVEESLGRFLKDDEVVHHKDRKRANNDIDNLEIKTSHSEHMEEHKQKRNPNGQVVADDPIFQEIKYRLYDEDRGITQIWTLSKLIGTTFRRGKFKFRGMFTGLKDRNGVEIYEGDVLTLGDRNYSLHYGLHATWVMSIVPLGNWELGRGPFIFLWQNYSESEVIGNIYETPELLTKKEQQ